jgi:hypothetical protein
VGSLYSSIWVGVVLDVVLAGMPFSMNRKGYKMGVAVGRVVGAVEAEDW